MKIIIMSVGMLLFGAALVIPGQQLFMAAVGGTMIGAPLGVILMGVLVPK